MVKKYKTKETGIILFLTFSALSISGAVTGVSFLVREIVNIALGNSQSWNKSIFLGALFLGAMILFLVFKNIGIRKNNRFETSAQPTYPAKKCACYSKKGATNT